LLHRRAWFAEVHDFLLFDFHTDGGGVDENVLAYSNGNGPTRSLVVFHDRFGSTAGTIRESAAYARKSASGTKRLVRRSLAEGLGLPDDPGMFVTFRDARTGLAYLRSCRDIHERGLWFDAGRLPGPRVLGVPRVARGRVRPVASPGGAFGGRGVRSLDDALIELQLEPVHAPVAGAVRRRACGRRPRRDRGGPDLDALEDRLAALLAAIANATAVAGDAITTRARIRDEAAAAYADAPVHSRGRTARPSSAGSCCRGSESWHRCRRGRDEPRLVRRAADGPGHRHRFRSAGVDEAASWWVADQVRVLLALPRPSGIRGRGRNGTCADRGMADTDTVRAAMGVNTWEGVEWLDRDRFANLLRWAARLDAIEKGGRPNQKVVDRLTTAAEAAGYRIDALLASLAPPRPTASVPPAEPPDPPAKA
jgi:hypothetical protein